MPLNRHRRIFLIIISSLYKLIREPHQTINRINNNNNYIIGIYNIIIGDIYNYNKTGMRLSIGKKEKVITTIFKALRITTTKDTS